MQKRRNCSGLLDSLRRTPSFATSAWLQFLSRQTEVKGNTVGAVGYCTGGAMVMRAAAHYPDSIVAAASFHGAALGAKSPDSPHQLASRIRAKPHIGLAETDFWMPPR